MDRIAIRKATYWGYGAFQRLIREKEDENITVSSVMTFISLAAAVLTLKTSEMQSVLSEMLFREDEVIRCAQEMMDYVYGSEEIQGEIYLKTRGTLRKSVGGEFRDYRLLSCRRNLDTDLGAIKILGNLSINLYDLFFANAKMIENSEFYNHTGKCSMIKTQFIGLEDYCSVKTFDDNIRTLIFESPMNSDLKMLIILPGRKSHQCHFDDDTDTSCQHHDQITECEQLLDTDTWFRYPTVKNNLMKLRCFLPLKPFQSVSTCDVLSGIPLRRFSTREAKIKTGYWRAWKKLTAIENNIWLNGENDHKFSLFSSEEDGIPTVYCNYPFFVFLYDSEKDLFVCLRKITNIE